MPNNYKSSGLAFLVLGLALMNDATAGGHQIVQQFGDSAIQGFNSRMNDSAIQRFDSRMRSSMVQRFESRMLRSPVQDFNSDMLNSAIQRFHSRLMFSPAQRVEGPWKSVGSPTTSFLSIGGGGEETMRKQETLPKPPQSIAPSQFISVRCGIFTEMTIGKDEMLSEKEGAPCDHSEDGLTVVPDHGQTSD